jgi:hypothetical protein
MSEINEESILAGVADTATDRPIEINVEILPANRVYAFLQAKGLYPKVKKFIIRPITLGNLIRISKLLLGIDMTIFDRSAILESNYLLIERHTRQLAQIVAIAIHNSRQEPPESLVNLVVDNFSSKELLGTIHIVLKQMDISNFMSSIISVRGLNVLDRTKAEEMSPVDQGR